MEMDTDASRVTERKQTHAMEPDQQENLLGKIFLMDAGNGKWYRYANGQGRQGFRLK